MVLPDRIELSTSPLPMECSTTELRQHARYQGIGLKGPYRRAVLATRAPPVQARGRGGKGPKSPKIGAGCFDGGNSGPIRFPSPLPDLEMRGIGVQASDATRPALLLPYCSHGQCTDVTVWLFFAIRVIGSGMKGDQDKDAKKSGAEMKDSRRDRLKLALRENLKRRKSQARGRGEASASSESADASLDDAGGEEP
jgi:hypothetical protein